MNRNERMNHPRRLIALLAVPGFAMLAGAAVAEHRQPPRRPVDSAATVQYREECGSCHLPFPPRGLPPASWQRLMAELDQHFGTDASIDTAASRAIGAWLQANAGREPVKTAARPLLRMTESPWFQHEHDEIGADAFRRPGIKGPANCGACHRGAAEGRFGEHDIRVPQ